MVRNTKNSTTSSNLPQASTSRREAVSHRLDQTNPDISGHRDVDLDSLSEDCRAIFVLLSRKLDTIFREMEVKNDRLQKCEEENVSLRERVASLESQVEDIESRNRCKNLILSGKVLSELSNDNLTNSCVHLLRQKTQYSISPENVQSIYRIGARPAGQSPDCRNLLIKLRDEDIKRDILSACRTTKPSDMYANEDLIPSRARLLYLLRRARVKSSGRIAACGSSNGNIYALIKPPDLSARPQRTFVKSMGRLESLCSDLGISFPELMEGVSTR